MDRGAWCAAVYGVAQSCTRLKWLSSSNLSLACSGTSVVCDSLWPHGLYAPRFLCPWDFPGKNTGVAFHVLLQQIFPTRGSKLCPVSSALQANSLLLRHWRSLNLCLGHVKNISRSHIITKKFQPSCFSFMQSSFIPIRNLPAILHVELNEVKSILNWSLWLRPCSLNRKKWQGSESSLK